MKRNGLAAILSLTATLGILFGLLGCAVSPPDAPVMPPRAPQETIQSTILPAEPTPLPAPSLPEGVQLHLDGKEVTFEDLVEVADGTPAPTVRVRASATTKYRSVERVLDRLHDLGYLIEFEALPSR